MSEAGTDRSGYDRYTPPTLTLARYSLNCANALQVLRPFGLSCWPVACYDPR